MGTGGVPMSRLPVFSCRDGAVERGAVVEIF